MALGLARDDVVVALRAVYAEDERDLLLHGGIEALVHDVREVEADVSAVAKLAVKHRVRIPFARLDAPAVAAVLGDQRSARKVSEHPFLVAEHRAEGVVADADSLCVDVSYFHRIKIPFQF